MLDLVKRRGGHSAVAPVTHLQEEMNELFDRLFNADWLGQERPTGWWPAMDLAERGDAIIVKAEVPGLKAEDIEISVEGNVLTISGEKKEAQEEKGENYYHCERRYGTFRRSVNLSQAVQVDQIKAEYHEGILTVTMPKSEQAKSKRIEVKS
jgi:HSP20 family protein